MQWVLGLLALLALVIVVGFVLKAIKWLLIIALVVVVLGVARGVIGRNNRKAL